MGVRVEVIDRDGLIAIERAWAELWERSPGASCFQHPDWGLPWCRHLLRGEVHALAAWRGGNLEGLLPLFRWSDGDATVLSLIGAGVSDYQDLLVDPEAHHVVASLVNALAGLVWDRLELSELRERSPVAVRSARARAIRSPRS